MESFVTLCQPMSRRHTAYFEPHDYTQGPSALHPGDVNWDSPRDQDDGARAVVFEVGNLPPGSLVRAQSYVSNNTRCSLFSPDSASYNGDRTIVDIWVAPNIDGAVRAEKYLGYGIYQHMTEVVTGEIRLVAGPDGSADSIIGTVYGDAGSPAVESCWYGPHIHQVASRDFDLERRDGTYTTGIAERFSPGIHSGLGAGAEAFRFTVDWDL